MCLIGIAYRTAPGVELVVAANRDEFHARPCAPAAFWEDAPNIFGGRDLQGGGTWLAATRDGRFAAVTNVRRMVPPNPRAPSRGALVTDFLRSRTRAADYAASLRDRALDFSGFNLLLHDGHELRYVDNHPAFEDAAVKPGLHVVSNDQLDTPWPKSLRLRAVMERSLEPEPLFAALGDRAAARDDELPDTGVGLPMERMLSPPFIVSERYGTRCSTWLRIGGGRIEFEERRFGVDGRETGRTRERVDIA